MRISAAAALLLMALTATEACAEPPNLIVAIAVDQFSADLFAQYRGQFRGGLKRLAGGVVFPKGYQSHAATETCPGHSTILTGDRPARTGIIANEWVDQSIARTDKTIYCVEDPAAAGSSSKAYTPSLTHLRVPTLGDRMKVARPGTRVVAVAGKDRAALLLGGKAADEVWWWTPKGFATLGGRGGNAAAADANRKAAAIIGRTRAPFALPAQCAPLARPVPAGDVVVGDGRLGRASGDEPGFRASPDLDTATLDLASRLIEDAHLGRRGGTDLLAVSLSATDYIGHAYGTEGAEMCIQIDALDRALGTFLERLDRTGIDYLVVLTADHGGHDLPERGRQNGVPDEARADPTLRTGAVNAAIAARSGIGRALLSQGVLAVGDVYLRRDLSPDQSARAKATAISVIGTHPQVAAVFSREQIVAAPPPVGPPESWTLLTEAKASFDPDRSGDLVVLLKPRVTPILTPARGRVATHGSPWDYDRRVPILFWRRGIVPFEQPMGVETVDIMPTLAAAIGLPLAPGTIDGRCLDIVAGPQSGCP